MPTRFVESKLIFFDMLRCVYLTCAEKPTESLQLRLPREANRSLQNRN